MIGGEDSEDDNGPSVVPAADVSLRNQISEVQDLLDFDMSAEIDNAVFGEDEAEEEEPIIDEEKEIFRDTEFTVIAFGEDPEHVEIESSREPADDEYEEDEDENGIVVIKKRSELKTEASTEETLPVLSDKVARNFRLSIHTIVVRYAGFVPLPYSDFADDHLSTKTQPSSTHLATRTFPRTKLSDAQPKRKSTQAQAMHSCSATRPTRSRR